MNVLINFSTLKKGGGQNVGLNFLHSFLYLPHKNDNDFYYVVSQGSALEKLLKENGQAEKMVVVSSNPLKRICQEFFTSNNIIKRFNIDIVYTYFGYALYPKKVPQVIGCAVSNVFYPEIDFWSQYHGFKRWVRDITDKYRIWGIKRADGIIFETDILNKRSKEVLHVKGVTTTIRPSISIDYENEEICLNIQSEEKRGLFLCGWQLNKNILSIPAIAHVLKQKNIPFTFILTAPEDHSMCHRMFLNEVKRYGVEEYINIIGPVRKKQLKSLYKQVDIVFLLSKLESFSNNIIESWSFEKPMIVADELWARDICKEAALYVNRDDNEDIANGIQKLITHPELCEEIIDKGKKELRAYPDIDSKTKQELAFIEKVYEKNH